MNTISACSIDLYKNTVYIMPLGQIESGGYKTIEPVSVIPASMTSELHQAIKEILEHPITILPHERWNPKLKPLILKYAKLRSWSSFVQSGSEWTLKKRDNSFLIITYKKEGRALSVDSDQTIRLPGTMDIDQVCNVMIEIVQKKAGVSR